MAVRRSRSREPEPGSEKGGGGENKTPGSRCSRFSVVCWVAGGLWAAARCARARLTRFRVSLALAVARALPLPVVGPAGFPQAGFSALRCVPIGLRKRTSGPRTPRPAAPRPPVLPRSWVPY
jgi:hypothetical protein